MATIKFLLTAAAASIITTYVQATPVTTAAGAAATNWTPLPWSDLPAPITLEGINQEAYADPANWNQDLSAAMTAATGSNDTFTVFSGACEQGECPDYHAAFDLVYQFTAVPVPGDPPPTIFGSTSDIRVDDCGVCQRARVGSNLGDYVPGGCWDFNSCGREQQICVDPGNYRAHRIWKGYVKTCYHMQVEILGECGYILGRDVIHPIAEVACDW